MELFVIRHARAEDRDAERWPDDALRPLTREGARSFERLARRIGRWRPDVDLVLASGWTRAWDTARILRAHAGWPKPARTKLLESDDPSAVAGIVALVRHEPALGLLVSELCSGGTARVAMRKGAVAWLKGEPGAMSLEGLMVPGMLRRD